MGRARQTLDYYKHRETKKRQGKDRNLATGVGKGDRQETSTGRIARRFMAPVLFPIKPVDGIFILGKISSGIVPVVWKGFISAVLILTVGFVMFSEGQSIPDSLTFVAEANNFFAISQGKCSAQLHKKAFSSTQT